MSGVIVLALLAASLPGGEPLVDREYRFEMNVMAETKVPVFGGVEGGTRTRGISRFVRAADGSLEHHFRVCDVELEGGGVMAKTRVPEAFKRALKPKVGKVTMRMGFLEIDLGQEYIGFDEAQAGAWPPEGPKSPGVIDSDKDGQPGATLVLEIARVGKMKLFIAQRARSILLGQPTPDGGFEGQVRMALLEQKIVDTAPRLFKLGSEMKPLDDKSSFKLEPLAPGQRFVCGAAFPDLMPRTPALRSPP